MPGGPSPLKKKSPKHYSFPYVQFHGRSYPLIPLCLIKGKKQVNTFALIDSGASISVFRPEIAKELGIKHKTKNKIHLGTANGGVDIAMAKAQLMIESSRFTSKIGFSKNVATSFNILGREGFFPRFSICFNEKVKRVILVPLGKKG